jgi:hypothetical protein
MSRKYQSDKSCNMSSEISVLFKPPPLTRKPYILVTYRPLERRQIMISVLNPGSELDPIISNLVTVSLSLASPTLNYLEFSWTGGKFVMNSESILSMKVMNQLNQSS